MQSFDFDDRYDGTDDNIEILLEDAAQDSGQAYLYVRIYAKPDETDLVVKSAMSDMGFTPNSSRVSVLCNGTQEQLAIAILELFEMSPVFMEAFVAAVKAVEDFKNKMN